MVAVALDERTRVASLYQELAVDARRSTVNRRLAIA